MSIHASFKRLILRAVLRNVSPMVIRILAVPDSLDLFEFDEVFRAVLGWDNIGFLFRVHGQEFNSFRRATRSRRGATAILRRAHRLPADVETSKDGRSDVHAGADGGCPGNVGRLPSRGATRNLALLSRNA